VKRMAQTFIVEYLDNCDLETRARLREEHIAFRRDLGAALALAGPLLNRAGDIVGSVIIVDAEDLEAAETMAKGDPLVSAGVLQVISVRPFRIAYNRAPGS
jgi:uncharacterized protein YciI